ncbi:lipid IV(A) 3-deoxy-D-manno-octulosonic acid transferase [Burkholderiaceae bacterium DAT-1]|nr:lipid IV(A) 3-deoxy-D-manno-octulosonic acid transferase [Burkholderiaceae bacterium DAT-1]
MLRRLYSLAWYLATPLIMLYLWRRSRQIAGYADHWGERFGYYPAIEAKPILWVHSVSVGETRAAAPLIRALQQHYPHHQILMTGMTPTGRDTARKLFGDGILQAYLPYDQPGAVKRFLRHYRPDVGLILETELWPNLFHFAKQLGVPVYVVNARLSDKSLAGYMRIRHLIAPALGELSGIAAQSDEAARKLRELAGSFAPAIQVSGNLKFDFHPGQRLIDQGRQWRKTIGKQPTWLAASTREGEEALILAQLACSPWAAHALLILVPRHPERFDEVADLLDQHALTYVRRSQWDGTSPLPAGTQVILGDSMGEMTAWLSAVDVAFVGGSLLAFGCHNVIEPCALGCPVVFGPSTFNFPEATAEALAAGAARQVQDASELIDTVSRLLDDPSTRNEMRIAGRALVNKHKGAVERVIAMLPAKTQLTNVSAPD